MTIIRGTDGDIKSVEAEAGAYPEQKTASPETPVADP